MNLIYEYHGVSYLVNILSIDEALIGKVLIRGFLKTKAPVTLPPEFLEVDNTYSIPITLITQIKASNYYLVYDKVKFASYNFFKFTQLKNEEEANKWKPLIQTLLTPSTSEGPKYA